MISIIVTGEESIRISFDPEANIIDEFIIDLSLHFMWISILVCVNKSFKLIYSKTQTSGMWDKIERSNQININLTTSKSL